MKPSSRIVNSNQLNIHPDLAITVQKHLSSRFQKPLAVFNKIAFEQADLLYKQFSEDFILDSGCGVGESTYHLAKQYPNAFIVGVDQSEHRIASNSDWTLPDNAILIRADLVDFWRLAAAKNWQLSRHFILYPNPWPKKKHLQRRWHGHPVFSVLKELGGELELRTNWQIYGEEFSQAINLVCDTNCKLQVIEPDNPITPFERKYQLSGQTLYQLKVSLSGHV